MKKSKKKLSKKTKISALMLLAFVGGVAGLYLLNRNNGDVLSWQDSNWLYRRSITVANSQGSTLTNEEVLIEVDTASMVSDGKLQADCDDLRFYDSDDSTSLTYWVEGACNTDHTQVWVRIPSLPAIGSTIYMYYGNESAANAEASWTGSFILPSTTLSCATGWSRFSALDNKFPYGSATAGTTGGASSHAHNQASCTSTAVIDNGTDASATDKSVNVSDENHTHTNLKVDINSATVLPPYQTVYFCSNSNLDTATTLPFFFDSTQSTGWTQQTSWNGKFLYGGTTSTTGGSSTHTHTTTGGYETGSSNKSLFRRDLSGTSLARLVHTHNSLNGTTGSANSLPLHKDAPAYYPTDGTISGQPISMTTAAPPLGWTRFSSFDSRFLQINSTYNGTTSGANTHTHSVTIQTGGSLSNINVMAWDNGGASSQHYHTCTTTSSSNSNIPPYYSVLYYKRDLSESITVNSEELSNLLPTAISLLTEGETTPLNVTDLTPELSAIFTDDDSSDTGNYYQIQVNTTSAFDGTTMWDSTKTAFGTPIVNGERIPDISYAGTTLTFDSQYYWRIKFWDNRDGEGEWSSAANFIVNHSPNQPSSLETEGDTNPLNVTDLTPELSAIFTDDDLFNTGNYYQIQINTTSTFDGTTMWDSNKTAFGTPITNGERSSEISYAGTTPSYNIIYYWRIQFWDNHDSSSGWSPTNTFKIIKKPNSPTELLTNGGINPTSLENPYPYFSAIYTDNNALDSSAYEIEINTSSTFTGTVMWDSTKQPITISEGERSSNIAYKGTPLSNTKNTLYWRIRFWNTDDNASDWSETATFIDFYPSMMFEGLNLEGVSLN